MGAENDEIEGRRIRVERIEGDAAALLQEGVDNAGGIDYSAAARETWSGAVVYREKVVGAGRFDFSALRQRGFDRIVPRLPGWRKPHVLDEELTEFLAAENPHIVLLREDGCAAGSDEIHGERVLPLQVLLVHDEEVGDGCESHGGDLVAELDGDIERLGVM